MVYMGSKNKISKHLKPIIESYLASNNFNTYVEPFVGGANMIDKIECDIKIGIDINKYLIALHRKAQYQPLPLLDASKETYNIYREMYHSKVDDERLNWLIGYYGFLGSFNGRFFEGGYGGIDKYGKNLLEQRLNNLNKQRASKLYQDIIFSTNDYKNLNISHSIIYLDPPYKNRKEYSTKFNHNELWEKCKQWSKRNNVILLSELEAPSNDWEEIWSQEHQYTLRDGNNENKQVIEKLFIWKPKEDN